MKYTIIIQSLGITLGSVLLIMTISQATNKGTYWKTVNSVFAEQKPIALTEENLVDSLVQLDLHVRLSRAELAGSILSVDLKVNEQEFNKAELYRGMAEVISFAFERTSNVDQLLLRIVAEDRWIGSKYLLLAADVRRGGWSANALIELRDTGNYEVSPELKSWFRITESHLWKQQLLSENGNITSE